MDRRVVAVQAEEDEMVRQRQRQRQLVRERGRRIKAAAELGLARSSSGGRQWGRALGRRALLLRKGPATAALSSSTLLLETSAGQEESKQGKAMEGEAEQEEEEEEEEEEVMVDEKVAVLRQLVPGGEAMAVERLLDETADYIAALRAQVGVMRALACLLSGLGSPPEKEISVTPEKPI
ncbi:transcription factor IBH1-like [Oryza glaberrima]|uniref:BHLH domain-containing protein n=1 Tax=Oryza glaberrima TaxID=4538 RepID=I1NPX0_ORYGL|nr:transcription factor IBH1-like [Oryza glaberrima]